MKAGLKKAIAMISILVLVLGFTNIAWAEEVEEESSEVVVEETAEETVEEAVEEGKTVTAVRLYGNERYETAGKVVNYAVQHVSQDVKTDVVLLATGQNFPDALAASGLAAYYKAPILMTSSGSLSSATRSTIAKLKPSKIIVIGGTSAVSDSVANAAKQATGVTTTVERIFGNDRYDTAVKLFENGYSKDAWGSTCIVATGESFPDALSISPFAFHNHAPIFLATKTGLLNESTIAAIKKGGFDKMVIVGGDSCVKDEVSRQTEIKKVVRLGGVDRYDTSLLICKWCSGDDTSKAFMPTEKLGVAGGIGFAVGTNYPDALVGGVYQGAAAAPMLLVNDNANVLNKINTWITPHVSNVTEMHFYGGTSAISKTLGKKLLDMSKYDEVKWAPSGVQPYF